MKKSLKSLFRARGSKRVVERNLATDRPYFYLGEGLALTRLKSGHYIYVDPLEESVCAHLIAHGTWEPWIGFKSENASLPPYPVSHLKRVESYVSTDLHDMIARPE